MHLPQDTIRQPQAVPLSVKIRGRRDGNEGRGSSLHMDACASILRPLSPYGHGKHGLPPYPRLPALRCCGSSVRRGIRCHGLGGQGLGSPPCGRDDYGVQRERSGITRAASRYATDISPLLPSLPNAKQKGEWKPARRSCVFGLCPAARVDRCPVHFAADTFRL